MGELCPRSHGALSQGWGQCPSPSSLSGRPRSRSAHARREAPHLPLSPPPTAVQAPAAQNALPRARLLPVGENLLEDSHRVLPETCLITDQSPEREQSWGGQTRAVSGPGTPWSRFRGTPQRGRGGRGDACLCPRRSAGGWSGNLGSACASWLEDALSSHHPCQPTPGVVWMLRKPGSQAPDSPGTTGPMKGRAQGFSW